MDLAWEQAKRSADPILFLREYVASREFSRQCLEAAESMVTAVQTDNGRTWREAAFHGNRERSIHLALRQGLSPKMKQIMERQMTENAALISRTPIDVAQYVVNEIREKAFEGLRPAVITEKLLEQFPLASQYRINTIARTETGKAYTMLTMAQSEDLGIDWYLWRTSVDSRVRSSHEHMEDVLVSWSDPPSPEALVGLKSVGKYHAGNIYNCRCYPEPVISWDYVEWPHQAYMGGVIRRMSKGDFAKSSRGNPKHVTPVLPTPQPAPAQMPATPNQQSSAPMKPTFNPATITKHADDFAQQYLANAADYDNIPVEIANEWNEVIFKTQEMFPELRPNMDFIGTCQARNRYSYEKTVEEYAVRLMARPGNSGMSKQDAVSLIKRYNWVKRPPRVSAGTFAESMQGAKYGNGISVNEVWAKNPSKFNTELKRNVAIKFHPVGCDTVKSIVDHEMGHQIDGLLKLRTDPDFVALYQRAKAAADVEDQLSRYALKNHAEFIAEAWAEYQNNLAPRKYACEVVALIKKKYLQLTGKVI